jgi:hypothetical protein
MTREAPPFGQSALHARYQNAAPIRIAITGASGIIGSALRPFLVAAGHQVITLVRRSADASAGEIQWDPATGVINADALEGVDAVVHLAGENIGDKRWTAERKRGFIASRVQSTQLISRTLAQLKRPPRVLVSASAIGFYGDRGDEPMTESSAKGIGFLPDLCEAWESATASASEAGLRVVNLRIGVVISRQGGALRKLLTPFKLGLGGVMGDGRQYLSWISAEDVVGSLCEAVFNDHLSGPVNATAPTPVSNREFVKALGHALRRPTVVPYPALAIKLLYGEMGVATVLAGARVVPKKLRDAGFTFRHERIESVLRDQLG